MEDSPVVGGAGAGEDAVRERMQTCSAEQSSTATIIIIICTLSRIAGMLSLYDSRRYS